MKFKLLMFVMMSFVVANAQSFMPALSSQGMVASKEAYVIKNDGTKISGKVSAASLTNNVLKTVNIKGDDGVKYKFKAQDIKELAVKPKTLFKIEQSTQAKSVLEASKVKPKEVMNEEYVYFEQAILPGKKNKFALMQLLNPGFDHALKVYKDPNSKHTMGVGMAGVQLTGGKDKSYLVCETGSNRAVMIQKNKYTKEAVSVLYADKSKVFKEHYAGDKLQWKDFAEHVYVYDNLKQ